MKDDDKYYNLVKDALECSRGEYFGIMEKSAPTLANVKDQYEENREILKMNKKYCSKISSYVIEKLDSKHKEKFISVMNDPFQIDIFSTLGESYFDSFGFQAGHILAILYYINNVNIDSEKCLNLNHLQKEIMNSEMYEFGKRYGLLKKGGNVNNGAGCSFVILIMLLPLLVFGIKIIM